ncbi:TPA: glycosyltransferase family 2 protein [Klebsiella quasipneumoniae subsp. similipneumoniae]
MINKCFDNKSNSIPYFSIVIPTYNSSLTISRTLDSIRQQSFKDFEVIIVDDNSSDRERLVDVINTYNYELNIKIELSDRKLNGAGARNLGIIKSRGFYVAFLDSDDVWSSNKLHVVAEKLKEIEATGIKKFIMFSQVDFVVDGVNKGVMPLKAYDEERESIAEYIFGCNGFIQTSTIVARRVDLLKLMFNDKFTRHQDYDLNIRASFYKFSFIYIDQPLSTYATSRKSHKIKGEGVKYSYFWLNEMKPYLTKKDIFSYKAFRLSQRYLDDNNKLGFVYVFVINFIRCRFYQQKAFICKFLNKITGIH